MAKRYRAICTYETIESTIIPIEADSEEEAMEKAHEDFKRYNDNWVKGFNGPEKRLIGIEIKKR